jgi:glutathione S-transferase
MLELYHHSTSVCSAKVRLALGIKGVEWTGRFVDIIVGEQFKPEFLKINPKALVPVIVHDGRTIRESTVINEYVNQAFPGRDLVPADAFARAGMLIWTKLVDEALHPACAVITYALFHRHRVLALPPDEQRKFLDAPPDPVWREKKRSWIVSGLDAPDAKEALKLHDKTLTEMESALADRQWLAGGAYSLADIALTPYVNRLDMLGMDDLWSKGKRPRLANWFARIRALPNFKPAVLDWIPPDITKDMRAKGEGSWPQVAAMLAGK